MNNSSDLAGLVAHERARDQAFAAHHRREAQRNRGVCWSGLGPDPWRPRSEARLRVDAQAAQRRLTAWRASQPGRLLASVAQAQRAAAAAHLAAEAAAAAASRGLENNLDVCRAESLILETQAIALLAAARSARAVLAPAGPPCPDIDPPGQAF